ncbi:MAG: glycosyltransferase [Kiritimatiellia bacterium]
MKVAQLLPAMEQGGVETVVCDLNRVLVRAGWSSVVVSGGGRLAGRIERDGGRHLTLELKSKNPLTYPWRVLKLRRLLRQERPDLVCVHSRVPAWLYVGVRGLEALAGACGRPSARAFSLSAVPWITYAHGANSVSRYSAVMTRGDLVVVPSRFLADYLKANYGLAETKLRIVPNAVDADRFDPARLDGEFMAERRREWGIRTGDHVLMAVGRITKVKGLDDLIRRFAQAAGGPEPASPQKLVIVGGADRRHRGYLESLRALVRSLGLDRPSGTRAVVFAGPQEKIPECLAIADEIVSANTTKPETFGLSVVEAYAMNRPVRARRFGGVGEVMAAVEQSGCASLREAVLRLYGLDRYAGQTLAVYREALDMV